MAAVIPKLTIEPKALHSARRKLQTKQPDDILQLTADEREALLQLISRGKRLLYPSQMELDIYQANIDQLSSMDPINCHNRYEALIGNIKAFEIKYCK